MTEAERQRLSSQLTYMQCYLNVLDERIKNFRLDAHEAHFQLKDKITELFYTAANAQSKHDKSRGSSMDSMATARECDRTRGELFIEICAWAKSKGATL